MIVREFYETRPDGVRLYRTVSDTGLMIRKDGTDELYSEAIDPENSSCTYTETETPIGEDTAPTVEDMLSMLAQLGVNVDA